MSILPVVQWCKRSCETDVKFLHLGTIYAPLYYAVSGKYLPKARHDTDKQIGRELSEVCLSDTVRCRVRY